MAKRSSIRKRTNNKKSMLSSKRSYKKRQSGGSGFLNKIRSFRKKNKDVDSSKDNSEPQKKKIGLWNKLKKSFSRKEKKSQNADEANLTTNNNPSKLSEKEIEEKRNKYLGLGAILTKKDGTRRTVKEMLRKSNELMETPEGQEFIKNMNSVPSQYESDTNKKSTNDEEIQREDELIKETNIKSVEKIIEKLRNVKTYDEFKAFLESHSPVFKEFRKAVKQKLESLIKDGKITSVEQINYLSKEKKFISKKSAVKSLEEIRKKIDEQIKLHSTYKV